MEEGRRAGPFVVVRLRYWIPPLFSLSEELGRELLRRLEESGHTDVALRVREATAVDPPKFVVVPADEPVLLAALDTPPELAPGVLADLRYALREIMGQAATV
jgi:hypothetical protein